MLRNFLMLLFAFNLGCLQAQIVRYNPLNVGLAAHDLEASDDSLRALSLYPSMLSYSESGSPLALSHSFLNNNLRFSGFEVLSDSLWLAWINGNTLNPTPLWYSTDKGRQWQQHPHLNNVNDKVFLGDSLFAVDLFLNLRATRYTLNGGQTYHSLGPEIYALVARLDSGLLLRPGKRDSLYFLSRNGLQPFSAIDTAWDFMAGGFLTDSLIFCLSEDSGFVKLSRDGQFLERLINLGSGTKAFLANTYFNGDTLCLAFVDTLVYSFDKGGHWQIKQLPEYIHPRSEPLYLLGHELIYSHGAGSLLRYNLVDDSIRIQGSNDYPYLDYVQPVRETFKGLEYFSDSTNTATKSRLVTLDAQGRVQSKVPAPIDYRKGSNLIFTDSLHTYCFEVGLLRFSADAGQTWQSIPDPDSIVYTSVEKGGANSIWTAGASSNGMAVYRFDSIGNRQMVNFQTTEGIKGIMALASDSLLVFAGDDVYRTDDGGVSFQAYNLGRKEIWHAQRFKDTLLLACRDSIYYALGSDLEFRAIAPQPILMSPFNERPPYIFFSSEKVLSYDTEIGRFVIAHSGYNFSESMSMPIGQISAIYHVDSGAVAVGHNGQFYFVRSANLFPEDISLMEPQKQSRLEVYPNPSRDNVYWSPPLECAYELKDINGRLIRFGVAKGSLELGDLPPGTYLLILNGSVQRLMIE